MTNLVVELKIPYLMGEKNLERYSVADYLNFDTQSKIKNEYDNGLIVAMSGGTLNHGIIGNNINSEINNELKSNKHNCISINGDVKIFIKKAKSFVYPDGMIVCGKIETDPTDSHAIINPKLVIEVLSKSTESYDRGDKFHKYCSLDSFCEYILVDQYKPLVDSLFRSEKGVWKMTTTIGLDKSIYLNSINCFLKMEDIYRNTIDLNQPQFRLDF